MSSLPDLANAADTLAASKKLFALSV